MSDLEIRPLGPDDDLDAQRALGERAFGLMTPAEREGWRRRNVPAVAAARYFAIFDGKRQVGGATWHDMRQWWAGRSLPMAGLAAVKIAPEIRGQGLGRAMVTNVLREIAARGYPLSALYPATMPIYRSLGWELAGGTYYASVPARSLRFLVPPDPALPLSGGFAGSPPRPVTAGDAGEVLATLGRAHQAARDCGPLTRDVASIETWIRDDPDTYRYLCGDDGFLSCRWQPGNGGLFVDYLVAATAASQRELLAVLAGYSSTADTVELRTAPDGPLWWLLRERDAALVKRSMWMLRVVDASAAIAGRGLGAGVAGSVSLRVLDDVLPGNAGTWRLTADGGKGALERAEPAEGTLTLGARGLAALYAGTPAQALRVAGLVSGGSPDDDAFLTAAFAGACYMLDDF